MDEVGIKPLNLPLYIIQLTEPDEVSYHCNGIEEHRCGELAGKVQRAAELGVVADFARLATAALKNNRRRKYCLKSSLIFEPEIQK